MIEVNSMPNFETMTPAQFEQYLPECFAAGAGSVSTDPRLQGFLARNPDCAALVHDLEAIAAHARSLFTVQEPSDAVWNNIRNEMRGDTLLGDAKLD